jgi:hypothetical protein
MFNTCQLVERIGAVDLRSGVKQAIAESTIEPPQQSE